VSPLRHRPIFGGVFGSGRYALATMPCTQNGLHAVRFMVIDPRGGTVLSIAGDKLEALSTARSRLKATSRRPIAAHVQWELWPQAGRAAPHRPVARRRREIFQRSNGRCHYCSELQTLEGDWHVEHMLPRALLGTNEASNLVVACRECNLAKSDKTAIEFIAQRWASAANDGSFGPQEGLFPDSA